MFVVYRSHLVKVSLDWDSFRLAKETLLDNKNNNNNSNNNWIAIVHIFQVYIVGHIPPGSDERDQAASLTNGHQFFSLKNNLRYLDLVRKYSSIIQGQFFGHLHSDSFRIVYNDQGK